MSDQSGDPSEVFGYIGTGGVLLLIVGFGSVGGAGAGALVAVGLLVIAACFVIACAMQPTKPEDTLPAVFEEYEKPRADSARLATTEELIAAGLIDEY